MVVQSVASLRGSSCSAYVSGKVGADPNCEVVVVVRFASIEGVARADGRMRPALHHVLPVCERVAWSRRGEDDFTAAAEVVAGRPIGRGRGSGLAACSPRRASRRD